MKEEINSYLTNIEEFVYDEKKIVTYSWLAKTLGIHTNLSKQLLHTFYDQSPKKDELSLTFLLIGTPDDNGGCQISIVKDKDLDECEASWKVITSKHIYSVQKCSDLFDLNVLYAAQKAETSDTLCKGISAIDFNCNERDENIIAKLRTEALPLPLKQPIGSVKKAAAQQPSKTKSPDKTKKEKDSEKEKPATAKDKGSVVSSMFKNNKSIGSNTGSITKSAGKPAANNKRSQGIGAFFSKSTNKQTNETKKPEESEKIEEEKESIIPERHSPSKENKPTLNIVKEETIVKKPTATENKTKTDESTKESFSKSTTPKSKQKVSAKKGNNKKKATKKVGKEQKKRKRLMVASDSESENGSEGDLEETREPTPEPQPTLVPDDDEDEDIISATPEPATRKRKKKLINKTCKTPDGYIMTKKEWVEVSSEEEETVPEKKFKGGHKDDTDSVKESGSATTKTSAVAKKEVPQHKKVSPQKTKQASLTSFFKKK